MKSSEPRESAGRAWLSAWSSVPAAPYRSANWQVTVQGAWGEDWQPVRHHRGVRIGADKAACSYFAVRHCVSHARSRARVRHSLAFLPAEATLSALKISQLSPFFPGVL